MSKWNNHINFHRYLTHTLLVRTSCDFCFCQSNAYSTCSPRSEPVATAETLFGRLKYRVSQDTQENTVPKNRVELGSCPNFELTVYYMYTRERLHGTSCDLCRPDMRRSCKTPQTHHKYDKKTPFFLALTDANVEKIACVIKF